MYVASIAVCMFTSTWSARGQTTTPTSTPTESESKGDVYKLDPFRVADEKRGGYGSERSLAGAGINQSLQDIPLNIGILNRQFLEDTKPTDIGDALQFGVAGVNRRGEGNDDLIVRGFSVFRPLIDGIPGGSFYAKQPMYDKERLEVLKGPAGLLYGQTSAVGGIINMVTLQPNSRKTAALDLSVGTDKYYSARLNATGPLGTGKGDNLAYRVTIAHESLGGYRDFQYDDTDFISASTRWRINEANTIEVYTSYHVKDFNPVYTRLDANKVLYSPKGSYSSSQPWSNQNEKIGRITASLKSHFSPALQMKLAFTHSRTTDDRFQHLEANLDADNVSATNDAFVWTFKPIYNYAFADFVSQFETGAVEHKILYGAQYSTESSKNAWTIAPGQVTKYTDPLAQRITPKPSADGLALFVNQKFNNDQFESYAQYQMNALNDRLIAVVGTRYHDFHATTQNYLSGTTSPNGNDIWIKRYGLVAKPAKDVSLYYNYSESWIFNSFFLADGSLAKPSLGVNKEIGLKVDILKGRIQGTISYFDLAQTNVRRNLAPNVFVQDLEVTSKGVDADLNVSFDFDAGRFDTHVAYYNARTLDELGRRQTFLPKEQYGIFGTYEVTKGALKSLRVGAGVSHMGDRIGSRSANPARAFPSMGSFTVVSMMLGYQFEKWRAQLNIENLTDQAYINDGIFAERITTGRPRNARITVTYLF